jgi:hypothetical protein
VVVAEPEAFFETAPVDDVAARIVERVTGAPHRHRGVGLAEPRAWTAGTAA